VNAAYIWAMKRKFAILNSFLAVAVLFSMLFQSLHSYEHLAKQFSEKHCHHDHRSAHEITHQHHSYDHCLVCDFTLGSFLAPEVFIFRPYHNQLSVPYLFTSDQAVVSHLQNNPPLRGPPVFIA
jgi:hypothetical protein